MISSITRDKLDADSFYREEEQCKHCIRRFHLFHTVLIDIEYGYLSQERNELKPINRVITLSLMSSSLVFLITKQVEQTCQVHLVFNRHLRYNIRLYRTFISSEPTSTSSFSCHKLYILVPANTSISFLSHYSAYIVFTYNTTNPSNQPTH